MKNGILTWTAGMIIVGALAVGIGCDEKDPVSNGTDADRVDKIPSDIVKRTPETDPSPPILHSEEFLDPVPLAGLVNTAGAEDSPFLLPDGKTLYFFFTPDVRVLPEGQLLDGVSGIWVSEMDGTSWSEPERVWLNDKGKLSYEGAVCVQGDEMWFASAREGYTGVNMFTAEWVDARWKNWTYSGDRLMKEIRIGEVHIHGDTLYFHSTRSGGKGSTDLWVTVRNGSSWSDPVNLQTVNTESPDGYPFVSSDGNQLWFTRTFNGTPAIFRSMKSGNAWSEPELIVSRFAGEPTLDDAGNLLFVHHFYEVGVMIEADIYIAARK